jgi:hypothetical protein
VIEPWHGWNRRYCKPAFKTGEAGYEERSLTTRSRHRFTCGTAVGSKRNTSAAVVDPPPEKRSRQSATAEKPAESVTAPAGKYHNTVQKKPKPLK